MRIHWPYFIPLIVLTGGLWSHACCTPADKNDAGGNAPDNTTAQAGSVPRPPEWAQPLSKPGLPNLHKVSGGLYRGAQPTAAGFQELQRMGIRAIINLRRFHTDTDELKGVPIPVVPIRMNAWHAEDEDIVRFLKIVTDPDNQPVFVHCQHGADRTGTMCAVYRIVVQGWSKRAALDEMVRGGFGYHPIWKNLKTYIDNLDIEKITRAAGLK